MTKTLLHRHTLATSLFLLSTFSPCAGIRQKSQQDIDGEKLLQAIRDILQNNDRKKAKAKAITLLNKTPTPNLEIKDKKHGATALDYAVWGEYKDIVELLLEKGAKPNLQNIFTGDTPLHDAVMQGHQDIVALLLRYNADKSITNKKGQTPLALANKLSDDKEGKQAIIKSLQTDHTNTIPSNPNTNLFNQKNIFIGIAILIIVAGVGYLLWPEPQDDDTPRPTKSNAQQEQSTKTTRTATAK